MYKLKLSEEFNKLLDQGIKKNNKMIANIKKVLVLAPHPDDGELGCGGSIAKFIEQGIEVFYAVFSPCNKSLPKGYKENDIYKEMENALSVLGIPKSNIIKFNFPVREFPKYRQEILDELIILRKNINPDLVFTPNCDDVHQDHQTISQESIRCFKHINILGYELPWNNLQMQTNFFINLDQKHIDSKVNALKEYKSQEFRSYFQSNFIAGLAQTRAIRVNKKYAEAFQFITGIQA